jgi:hypothetical protein
MANKARTSAAAFDSLLMMRKTADGSLTTTGTYDGVAIYETAARGAAMKVTVPAAAGTTPLATFIVQAADTDDDGSYTEIARSEPVGAVGEYLVGFSTQRDYVRLAVEISGTLPDFGAVQAGVVPLGI